MDRWWKGPLHRAARQGPKSLPLLFWKTALIRPAHRTPSTRMILIGWKGLEEELLPSIIKEIKQTSEEEKYQ